jgi:hypothetical protein
MAIHQSTLEKLQHFTLLATSTITATGDQTGVDLQAYDGEIQIILNATAAGSGNTLTFRIEDSANNSSYAAVTGGTFTAVANAASKQVLTLNASDLRRYIRLSCSAASGTPSSSVTVNGYGTRQYEV